VVLGDLRFRRRGIGRNRDSVVDMIQEKMAGNPEAPMILSAVDDMFFSSKIESAAGLVGVRVVQVLDAGQLEKRLADQAPRMIILDLNSRACAPLDVIRRIKADPRLSRVPIIGFLSHVQHELARQAREAGCDEVMPRSVFSKNLPEILKEAR
jgi:CheY-like chemotaxis protein